MAQATSSEQVGLGWPADAIVTSIVVPVHNERDNLPQLLEEIDRTMLRDDMAAHRPFEIVFVEDESTDGTAGWIDDAARSNSNTTAVHLKRSYGQSAALAAGFERAEGDVIIPMDGDLQNDPRDIPRLLKKLDEGYDVVSGRRAERNDPWHKTIPSAVQTRLAKLTGPDINDFGCTLKAYRADAVGELNLYGEEHRYIPAELHDLGYSITEIDVNHRPRIHGQSRYGVGRLVRGFADLVFHVLWNRFSSRWFHLFGGAGFGIMAAGSLLGLWLLASNWLTAAELAPRLPELLLAVSMVLFGMLTLMFGVILQVLTRMYYADEREYRVQRVVGKE